MSIPVLFRSNGIGLQLDWHAELAQKFDLARA